jgi:hypothetical protein
VERERWREGEREKATTSLPLAAPPLHPSTLLPSSPPAFTPAPVLARRGPARFTAPVDGPCDWAGALSVRFSRRALLQGSPINNRSHWPSLTFPATSWPALGLRSSSPTFTEYPTPHRSHPRPFVAWPAQHIRQSLCRVSASREGPASLPTT